MTSAQLKAADTMPAVAHKDMANAIRALAMDGVQKANSGHPGMPMGMADVATVLYSRFLKFDPANPEWPDRDRFILSAGHGSMLQYALLYLAGYPGMTVDELQNFRQLNSKTPGHPEYGHTVGIETTTGPLGQGIANSVGFALAERMLAARYGDVVDHYTYVIAGDGCLMEGISQEAISLAGHLKLARLIVLWDDNRISIDGATSLAVSDDQLARFKASGWHVAAVDGHDAEQVATAIAAAQKADAPSMIACRTIIGYGSPNKQGTSATHGAALGDKEVAATREKLGWPHAPFVVPEEILSAWRNLGKRGAAAYATWRTRFAALPADKRAEFERTQRGELPAGFAAAVSTLKKKLSTDAPTIATRKASEVALETLIPAIPELIGGSADLTESNLTHVKGMVDVKAGSYEGRYLRFGVREHGMAAAMNGMALHGGLIPYGGTFLVFADYCRPSIRLSALMGIRVIYVMTHDSIGLGEDGPTHQPVEHMASLRAIPNLNVFRPADAVETAECWAVALSSPNTPSVIALTRQGLPTIRKTHTEDNLCARGGYVLAEAEGGKAKVTLMGTGSEIAIAMDARKALQAEGVPTSVVSMVCWELFDKQSADYRRSVLGTDTVRVAVEAAIPFGWERYVGDNGAIIGMPGFGASAPIAALYKNFGITADAVAAAARARLKR